MQKCFCWKEVEVNKMPESVEAAMEYIKGYCLKHPYCENNGNVCRLYEKQQGAVSCVQT